MKKYLLLFYCLCLLTCQQTTDRNRDTPAVINSKRKLAKFEPADGQCILFVGQELESIGGLEDYNDGYFDHFQAPGGFTMYTNFAPGDVSFGYTLKGMDGTTTTDDWGDSPSNLSLQIADEDFKNSVLAIGLSLVNHEEKVADGTHDELVKKYGAYLKSLGNRPVFLRIGYEFDGHVWNFYDRESFIKAYRRIKDIYDEMGFTNIAYVWQSTGFVSTPELLEEWYPGDEYVDWCATSFFARWREIEMVDFARKKGKPMFIAEATPNIADHMVKFDGDTKEIILSNPKQAKQAWDEWFVPFFRMVNDNPDVVKAISYINCNWRSHIMWKENKTFQEVDARLQTSEWLSKKWKVETSKDKYLKASPDLFEKLGSE